MSRFGGYSKSKNNFICLTDEQIEFYYREAEIGDGKFRLAYFLHTPRTAEDCLNPNFLMDDVVLTANLQFCKKH